MKALIVDDNHHNRLILQHILDRQDVNFDEALDLFKNNTFDLVLMDIQMPAIDGLEARRQKRDYEKGHGIKHVPILHFLSMY